MKKVLSILIVMAMLMGMVPNITLKAKAVSVTADQAVAWCESQVGKTLDYDGAWGGQCVDFIMYYYKYLGVSPVGGNACDYASNSLPSGWSRIAGATPQKGDILVWVNGYEGYGHIAICGGSGRYYHQNWNGQYVQVLSQSYTGGFSVSGYYATYWGVIRPNFSGSGSSSSSITYTNITADKYFLRNKGDGTYLNIAYGSDTNCNNIHSYAFGNYDSQVFEITKKSDGYQMRPIISQSRVVNPYADTVVSGKVVNLYNITNENSQWWKFQAVGDGYVIRNSQNPNVCLTPRDANSMCVSEYTGSEAQVWYLEKACTVTYNANGGSGAPSSARVRAGYSMTISATTPTRTCYDFYGWKKSGSAFVYRAGKSITIDDDTTLYAYWLSDHSYSNACDTSCNTCGATRTISHSYSSATCTTPKTCTVCGATSGSALGHSYKAATCTTPKTCATCGVTSGSALGHSYVNRVCENCGGAEPEESDWLYTINNGEVTITGHTNPAGKLNIPSEIEGYPVTRIGSNAFRDCISLTSVTIPDSVTIIRNYAFYNCTGLTRVTIGESVTNINDHAFYYCINLTSVTIPDSVTSIGSAAFYNCTSLTSVTIPNSVTSIGYDAFSNCTGLKKVYITDLSAWCNIDFGLYSNPVYYAKKLYLNGELVTDLVIPDGVTSIGDYAFDNCTGITSVTIPNSVTSIGYDAFYNCTGLTRVTVGGGVTSIGNDAFRNTAYYNNSSNWENDVLYIGKHLIKAREALSGNYSIKNGTKTIGDGAFDGCTALKSITIPGTVTSIGSSAFFFCCALTSITIPDSVTSIGEYAFGYCAALTSITIPDSVTSIGEYVFRYCEALTNITIPDSVTSIGEYAFKSCTALTSVIIPDSVTSIGEYAFEDCISLTNITIPDSITEIGDSAFSNTAYYNDSNNWQDDVLYIGNYLIKCNDTKTGAYTIKDKTKIIVASAFYGCASLTSVTIPNSVTKIGFYAFSRCRSLQDVWYTGSQEDRANIDILSANEDLLFATWHYNTCSSEHSYDNDCDSDCNACEMTRITEHKYQWVTDIESSCVNGVKHEECTVCADRRNENTVIDATESHIYDNNCDSECNICGFARDITHEYTEIITEPTCTEQGYTTHACVCGESYVDSYTEATGHSYTSTVIPPTATEQGYTEHICSACGDTYRDNYTEPTTKTGTTEDGYKYSISNGEATITVYNGTLADAVIPSEIEGAPVTTIGEKAFYYRTGVTSVKIPSSVKTIGKWAFSGCKKLASITIPESVTSIGVYAFYDCQKLTEVNLPESITTIPGYMFATCSSLKEITLPDSITKIGYAAFTGCTALETITIPSGVTEVLTKGFNNCTALTTVNFKGTEEEWNAITVDATGNDALSSAKIVFEYGTHVHDYKEEVTAPTCTERGYTTYTCNCGDSYIGSFTKPSHKYTQTVVPPTATSQGYTEHTCSGCGDSYRDNYVDFSGIVSGVTATPSDVDITLSWDAYEGKTDKYYIRVYAPDGSFKAYNTDATSITVKNLEYDTDYTFKVITKNSSGYMKWTDADEVVSAMVIGERVVGLTATIQGKGAKIDFLPVPNAEGYYAYVYEADTMTRVDAKEVSASATSFVANTNLVAGKKYTVKITPKLNGKWIAGVKENGIGVTFTAPIVNPSSYTIADQTATTIRFSWDAVRGVSEYYIRVKEKETGNLVRTIKVTGGKTTASLARYTDGTPLSPETTYTLEFCAYVPGVAATYGAPVDITTGSFEDISVTARYNQNIKMVNLSWNSTTDAVAYYIYRINADGKKTYMAYLEGNDNTIYEFKAPELSGSYTYGIVAYEKDTSGSCYTPLYKSNSIAI